MIYTVTAGHGAGDPGAVAQASDQITSAILRLERQTERIADKLDNSISGRGRGNFPEPKP